MEKQNVREYEIVREELINIRNCITNYVGFLIGGSGFAVAGIVYIAKPDSLLLVKIGIPLILATLVTLVQIIIYYKFLSHNRYAGYCKLLNHEKHKAMKGKKISPDGDIILWEACMDILRRADYDEDIQGKILNKIEGRYGSLCKCSNDQSKKEAFENILNQVSGIKPPIDNGKRLYGFLYIRTVFGKIKTNSWPFPAFVNNIFIVLAPLFISLALWSLIFKTPVEYRKGYILCIVMTIIIAFFHAGTWCILAGKLYTVLEGSNTVDNFCWRFLPFRIRFLNESRNISPYYFFEWCPIHDHGKVNQKEGWLEKTFESILWFDKMKKPKWSKNKEWDKETVKLEIGKNIKSFYKGVTVITTVHKIEGQNIEDCLFRIGMSINTFYKGVEATTKVNKILNVKGCIFRIGNNNEQTVGDLSIGDKVFIPSQYIYPIQTQKKYRLIG